MSSTVREHIPKDIEHWLSSSVQNLQTKEFKTRNKQNETKKTKLKFS